MPSAIETPEDVHRHYRGGKRWPNEIVAVFPNQDGSAYFYDKRVDGDGDGGGVVYTVRLIDWDGFVISALWTEEGSPASMGRFLFRQGAESLCREMQSCHKLYELPRSFSMGGREEMS